MDNPNMNDLTNIRKEQAEIDKAINLIASYPYGFMLSLDKAQIRPTLMLPQTSIGLCNHLSKMNNRITALYDTGAYVPIWTASENILINELGLQPYLRNVPISGFGGSALGNAYRLPYFTFGDFTYPNMTIVACSSLGTVPFDMILSETMFKDIICIPDMITHKFIVKYRYPGDTSRDIPFYDKSGKLLAVLYN